MDKMIQVFFLTVRLRLRSNSIEPGPENDAVVAEVERGSHDRDPVAGVLREPGPPPSQQGVVGE